jgi:hypothetical protein
MVEAVDGTKLIGQQEIEYKETEKTRNIVMMEYWESGKRK